VTRSAAPGGVEAGALHRDLDWRFLLELPEGGFERLLLLGGNPGLAELALSLGVAREVESSPAHGGVFDALVVLRRYRGPLGPHLGQLRAGGSIYVELEPPYRMPGAVRSALEAAGAGAASWYGCVPDCGSRSAYVPRDRHDILRWYLETLVPVYSRKQAIGRTIRDLALSALPSALRVIGALAVVAVKGAASRPLPGFLTSPGAKSLVPGDWTDALILTPRNRRVVALPFPAAVARPLAVVKLSRTAQRNDVTQREQAVLRELHGQLSGGLVEGLPVPLGEYEWRGLVAGVESPARGRLLSVSAAGWRTDIVEHASVLSRVTRWLASFHQATERARGSDVAGQLERQVKSVFSEYAEIFGEMERRRRFFDEVESLASRLARSETLPLVWSQGDFNEGNIFIDGDRIAVVDWAGGQVRPPLFDYLYFLTSWGMRAGKARSDQERVQLFRDIFVEGPERSEVVRIARRELMEYLRMIRISPAFVPVITAAMWADEATHRAKRAAEDAEAVTAAPLMTRFSGYLEELARSYETSWLRQLADTRPG
jgi:aminoglycoside phosphotransferase (APT) family kinase protein